MVCYETQVNNTTIYAKYERWGDLCTHNAYIDCDCSGFNSLLHTGTPINHDIMWRPAIIICAHACHGCNLELKCYKILRKSTLQY